MALAALLGLLSLSALIVGQAETRAAEREASVAQLLTVCVSTICREYMAECQWYCDPWRGRIPDWLCEECLGFYVKNCKPCFEY